MQVVANGRADWIGWVELKLEEVDETATRMTARVINDLDADVLAVVEAESRPALLRFSERILTAAHRGALSYRHTMLIDGNYERGIDVVIMTREGFEIAAIESHVDDRDAHGRIFSRDCPAYTITTNKGNRITVLVNHLKSKGYGDQAASDRRRHRQAVRVKQIYDELIGRGHELVAIVGDLNDAPNGKALAALLKSNGMRDISEHPSFDDGGGLAPTAAAPPRASSTTSSCHPSSSPATQCGGIFRKGVWGGKNGTRFPHYPEITRLEEAASDHAAIWAEIEA